LTAQLRKPTHAVDFSQRYEELRRSALGDTPVCPSSLGMSVVILHGLTGWMLAWTGPEVPAVPRETPGIGSLLSGDRLHREIVSVFVDIALASEEAA